MKLIIKISILVLACLPYTFASESTWANKELEIIRPYREELVPFLKINSASQWSVMALTDLNSNIERLQFMGILLDLLTTIKDRDSNAKIVIKVKKFSVQLSKSLDDSIDYLLTIRSQVDNKAGISTVEKVIESYRSIRDKANAMETLP